MFFTIQNLNLPISTEAKKKFLKYNAKMRILGYRVGSNEKVLDNYCKTNFKCNLKIACLWILSNTNIAQCGNGFRLYFKNKKVDKLAALITYGNSELPGSKILTFAFRRTTN